MSRRSGLGRGLAALIPPATERRDRDQPTQEAGVASPADERAATVEEAGTQQAAEGSTSAAVSPPTRSPATGVDPTAGAADGASATTGPTASPGEPAIAPPTAPTDPETDEATDAEAATDPETGTVTAVGGLPVTPPASSVVAASTATYAEVPPGHIRPNPRQPRDVFDPEELEGLATSLADIGVLQPLVVRPLDDGGYELIAGERRLRAATLAGLEVVPVLIRHTDDADLLKEALVENIHRVQLNALEEAAAYEQLLEEFGVTQEELATRLGKSRPAISNALRLLRLPTAVQRRVAAGVLSAGHAKALLTLDDAAAQSKLAERIVAEGLSVRATEEIVRLAVLDGNTTSPRRSRSRVTAPGLVELQDDLSDALEARVRITMGARKGKVAIEFSSVDDLERIVAVIADGLGHRRTTGSE